MQLLCHWYSQINSSNFDICQNLKESNFLFMGAYAPILESLFLPLSPFWLSAVVRNGSQIVINYVSYIKKWSCHVILDQTKAWSILSNAQVCQNWCILVKFVSNLSKLVQTCQNWFKLVKISSKLVWTCQNWFNLVKIGLNLLVKIGWIL